MEKIIYTHLNDPEWIKKREENWDNLFWRTMQDQPKYYWGPIKKYYFEGDVDAFIRGKNSYFKKKKLPVDLHGPSIVQILEYSPAKDLEQIVFAINKAFHWYDVNRSIISERRIEAVKKSFLNQLCFFSTIYGEGFDSRLADEAFTWIYGDLYDPERVFPISLGDDKWQPRLTGYNEVCAYLMRGISRYLFVEDVDFKKDEFEVLRYKEKKYADYMVSLLPHVDSEFYAKDIKDKKYISESGSVIYPRQLAHREFFMGILGYGRSDVAGREEFFCRDSELLDYIKKKVFSLEMPSELSEFVDFIERNGSDSYYFSEKN